MNSINNNLMALNTANTLNRHYSRLAASIERLSTGLRVNSSADDAAGLAIRELMRVDIAATAQGLRNANDAISMLQVADGALGIIDEKLIRMKELAEQAASGTYDSTQRLIIASEYKAMADEIDRIARATDFNGIKLLDGSLSGSHNGSGLTSTGAMKIHFGAGNDSAEDYYYLAIGDCTTRGLGLAEARVESGDKIKEIAVETFRREHKTFKPTTSFTEYTDPDTGKTYYTDGEYFFSDLNNPAGSSLSWETEGEVIKRLRMTQATTTSRVGYVMYMDDVSGIAYYSRDNGATFTSDSQNPQAGLLDSVTDKDIIERLRKTTTTIQVITTWNVFEDPAGKKYFTCDAGLSYAPDVTRPTSNLLDSRNTADKAIINQLQPVMVEKQVALPKIYYDWYFYDDPKTGVIYYSSDGGNTFISNYTNPEGSRLNPDSVADKAIIDRLVPHYNELNAWITYDEFEDPQDNWKIYYTPDRGKTFISNYKDPDSRVTDPEILARLTPILDVVTGTLTYSTYEDINNGQKRYYSADNGKTYFTDLADPKGSALDTGAPGYAALIAGFKYLPDVVTKVETKFNQYDASTTYTDLYYSNDGGQTFYKSKTGGEVVLDASNPADQAAIAALWACCWRTSNLTPYYEYKDPLDPYGTYYSLKDGNGEQFIRSVYNTSEIVLDASIPAQKEVIDRLEKVHEHLPRGYETSFPDFYYIYKDPDSGTLYYKPDASETFTKWPNNPYASDGLLDPSDPADAAILDKLVPVEDVARKIEYIKVIEPGESVTVAGLAISTQEAAQHALVAIDRAIVSKDKIRAHLGALQNRLENTVSNLSIQGENLQAAESRISDTDVATEMTQFVRNQVLTQSAVAMLGQANSYPHILLSLLNG